MSDLMHEVNYLRFYHTAKAAVRDKDFLKNEAGVAYTSKVNGLMTIPFLFQIYQLSLTGSEA